MLKLWKWNTGNTEMSEKKEKKGTSSEDFTIIFLKIQKLSMEKIHGGVLLLILANTFSTSHRIVSQ